MSAKARPLYAGGDYLRRHPRWHEEDAGWKARKVIELVGRNRIAPLRVCEVGCGSGGILAGLAAAWTGCVFDGFEISPDAFAICGKKESPRLHFHLDGFIESEATGYDMVLLMDVIEHVEDPFAFLRAIQPRGRYKVLHIPLDLSVLSMLTRLPERVRESAGHLHYFTRDLALELLSDCGYQVLDAVYTNGSIELPSKSWKSALARLPRAISYSVSRGFTARVLGGCSLLVLAE